MPTKKPARAPASTCPAAEITSLRPDFQASRWRLLKRRPGEQELVGLLRRQIVEIEALDVADSETGGRVHVTVRERFRYALRSRAAPVPTCPIRSWRFFSPRDIPHFGRHIGFTGTELCLVLLDLVVSLHHLPRPGGRDGWSSKYYSSRCGTKRHRLGWRPRCRDASARPCTRSVKWHNPSTRIDLARGKAVMRGHLKCQATRPIHWERSRWG